MGTIGSPPVSVADWLTEVFGHWQVVADVSWPRPNSNVWRVRGGSETAFVKLSPSEDSFLREVRALSEVLPHAPKANAPTLIASTVDGLALVTSVVEGEVVRTLDPTPPADVQRRIHYSAAEAIASLHRDTAKAVQVPTELAQSRAELLVERSREQMLRGQAALTTRDQQVVESAQQALLDVAGESVPAFIHGDFQPRNWLWSSESDRTSLIDFEEATVGFCVEDFVWLNATTWSRHQGQMRAFLNGYGRTITDAEWLLLEAATVVAGLGHVGDGVALGIDAKVNNGLAALRTGADRAQARDGLTRSSRTR